MLRVFASAGLVIFEREYMPTVFDLYIIRIIVIFANLFFLYYKSNSCKGGKNRVHFYYYGRK